MTIPAMEIGDETPTALYRFYNASDVLLYVGITGNIKARFAQHAETKTWWPEVVRKTAQWHLTRESAADAEVKAITTEQPLYNVRDAKRARRELKKIKVTGEAVFDLALTKMPPMTLRLRMLELVGFSTPDALDALGIGPTHRWRVINGRTGGEASARPPRRSVQR